MVNLFYIPQDKRHSSAIIGIIKNPHHHHRHRRSTVRGGYSSVQSHKFYRIAHSTTTRRSEGPVLVGQWKNQHEAILVITPHRATDPLWYSNTFPFFFFFYLASPCCSVHQYSKLKLRKLNQVVRVQLIITTVLSQFENHKNKNCL